MLKISHVSTPGPPKKRLRNKIPQQPSAGKLFSPYQSQPHVQQKGSSSAWFCSASYPPCQPLLAPWIGAAHAPIFSSWSQGPVPTLWEWANKSAKSHAANFVSQIITLSGKPNGLGAHKLKSLSDQGQQCIAKLPGRIWNWYCGTLPSYFQSRRLLHCATGSFKLTFCDCEPLQLSFETDGRCSSNLLPCISKPSFPGGWDSWYCIVAWRDCPSNGIVLRGRRSMQSLM